jgi:hypothetical protein
MQVCVLRGREAVCNNWIMSPHYVILRLLFWLAGPGVAQVWWLRGDLHHLLAVGGAVRTGRVPNALPICR